MRQSWAGSSGVVCARAMTTARDGCGSARVRSREDDGKDNRESPGEAAERVGGAVAARRAFSVQRAAGSAGLAGVSGGDKAEEEVGQARLEVGQERSGGLQKVRRRGEY